MGTGRETRAEKPVFDSHPLFRDVENEHLRAALQSAETRNYAKGEEVRCGKPALYLLEEGKARVYRISGGRKVLVNTLPAGSAFGCAQLFGGDGNVTTIVAAAACRCRILPEKAIERLVETDAAFARNYIAFLTDRIRFLNKRIAAFTAGTGEQALASYLLALIPEAERKKEEGTTVKLPLKMAALASALNMSRPTLYRAFGILEERGAAVKEPEGNAVRILSVVFLKNISEKGESYT